MDKKRNYSRAITPNKFNNNEIERHFNSNYTKERELNKTFNNKQKIKFYSGPVDLRCLVSSSSASEALGNISLILNRKKIVYARTNPFKFSCSKNGLSFDIEIFEIESSNNFYFKFHVYQGDYNNFKLICNNLLNELTK